jgi:hypothetical protein
MSAVTSATPISHFGNPLNEADYASLEARWIDRDLAKQAGIRRVSSEEGRMMFGRKRGNCAGIIIPNVLPGAQGVREYRLRLDEPELEYRSDGTTRENKKYLHPPGRPNLAYFPPMLPASCLADPNLPIIIVEGEFKCLALWRLANHQAVSVRFLPLAFTGVWNWRGTVGKTTGPNGERRDLRGPIADLDRMPWERRKVIIAFDTDVQTKPDVQAARAALSAELISREALMAYLEWLIEEGKGIDDRLANTGPSRVLANIEALEYGDWRTRLLRNEEGRVIPCHENVALYLEHSPEWSGVLGYNEFTGGYFVLRQPPVPISAQPGQEIEDHFDTELVRWFERKYLMVRPDAARRVVDAVVRRHSFHPVRDYLRSLAWDGVARIGSWLNDYCGAEEGDYSRAVGEKFLISACARIMEPGCKVDHVLVLEGPQGIGKSRAVRILAAGWFTDQVSDFGSKDASMQLRGVWVLELSELDALNRSEMSRVKLFISQQQERFRLPYGKRIVDVPRQCVFIGTTNKDEWLRDETGGRRFWPVRCKRINVEALERDRDQLWAEALFWYQAGEKWWLEDEAIVQDALKEQRGRYEPDPWETVIEQWAERQSTVSIERILTLCLDKPKAQWTQADRNRIARSLKSLGWERYQRRIPESQQVDPQKRREWLYRRLEN